MLAALIFFTRLPFWRLMNVPKENFQRIISYWPLVGWLTSGLSVLVLYAFQLVLPLPVALLLSIICRILLTGALHEDGLADFLDGFGGGGDKKRVLSIMKDSHIGSYGTIGLILYFLLYYSLLSSLPLHAMSAAMLMGDPFCKGLAGLTTQIMPYARNENEAKNKVVYSKMSPKELIFWLVGSLVPLILWSGDFRYYVVFFLPLGAWILLSTYIRRKIGGYTGDCCGAVFLICELSFMVNYIMIWKYI